MVSRVLKTMGPRSSGAHKTKLLWGQGKNEDFEKISNDQKTWFSRCNENWSVLI